MGVLLPGSMSLNFQFRADLEEKSTANDYFWLFGMYNFGKSCHSNGFKGRILQKFGIVKFRKIDVKNIMFLGFLKNSIFSINLKLFMQSLELYDFS
jgi:hypothetical protein